MHASLKRGNKHWNAIFPDGLWLVSKAPSTFGVRPSIFLAEGDLSEDMKEWKKNDPALPWHKYPRARVTSLDDVCTWLCSLPDCQAEWQIKSCAMKVHQRIAMVHYYSTRKLKQRDIFA